MQKNVNPVDKNSPEYWAKMVAGGRYSLLLIVIFTVVNIVLLLLDANRYFLFSASIPYYFTAFGVGMDYAYSGAIGSYTTVAVIISALLIGVYLLCWVLSKKRAGWLTAALVLFSLDTVGLLVFTFTMLDSPLSNIMDIALHAWAIYELVMAVICAKKLRQQEAADPRRTDPEVF